MNGKEYPSSHTHKKFVWNNFCLCFISCLINISKKKAHTAAAPTISNSFYFVYCLAFERFVYEMEAKKTHNNVRIAWNSSVWTNSKRTMQTNEKRKKNGIVKKWSATNKWFTCTHTNRRAFSSFATKIYTSHEVWYMKSKARIHWLPSHWNSMWLIHWNGSNSSRIHFICFAYLSLYFFVLSAFYSPPAVQFVRAQNPKWTRMNSNK